MAFRHNWATNSYVRLTRLHRPTGIWLLMWPCWWAVALASDGVPSVVTLLAFALGAVLARAGGCIINDLWDRDIDAQVERTRMRPLASSEVSPGEALAVLAIVFGLSLLVAMALGWQVVLWSLAVLPLVAAYPMAKRVTWWPQAVLGLTFNWGVLVGWVAVQDVPALPAFALYAACFFWTLAYDTAYALQDCVDDARIGVKSSALRLGSRVHAGIMFFYVLFYAGLFISGELAGVHPLYHVLVGLAAGLTLSALSRMEAGNPRSCRDVFIMNGRIGGLIFLACVLGKALLPSAPPLIG